MANEIEIIELDLRSAEVVKEIISIMHGIYDDEGKWIDIESGKILGVVKFVDENRNCSIILNAKYQSLNDIYLEDEYKLHI
jgi:hypothetical protein